MEEESAVTIRAKYRVWGTAGVKAFVRMDPKWVLGTPVSLWAVREQRWYYGRIFALANGLTGRTMAYVKFVDDES